MNVLLIDDDQAFRDAVCHLLQSKGHQARPAISGAAGMELLRQGKFDVVLLDGMLEGAPGLEVLRQIRRERPHLPVVMFCAENMVSTAVEAMRAGAVDFLEKPFTFPMLHAAMARAGRSPPVAAQSEPSKEMTKKVQSRKPHLLLDFAGLAMGQVREVLACASKSSATILITGESGTGKSVLARAIHDQSHRAGQPFITVSCPSLSKELLESELFGHTKGSFTGAQSDRWGKVKAAAGGTLFLDEIGDLPMEIQSKLLRLLQEKEYERLGENVTQRADIRVIAATNRSLVKRIAQGAFREDLYFRINVISVEMPPLRVRRDGVATFANHYLQQFAAECGREMREFSKETISRMEEHSWPGNFRELRNSIERAVILSKTDQVNSDDLQMDSAPQGNFPANPAPHQTGDLISLRDLDELHMQRVLHRTGNIEAAAKILGIDASTYYRRQKRWADAVCLP